MADSSRPRPRPRPKPKVQAASRFDTEPTPRTSPAHFTIPTATKPIQVEDEDAKFLRNRGRTTKAWERLDKLNKVSEAQLIHVDSDSDDADASPRRRKQKRKAPTPAWQSSKALDRLLSVDLSSDSDKDEEIEFLGTSNTPRASRQRLGRKRQRTRSRSITPPPAVPLHQLQNARALVQQALNTAPRPASPTLILDDDDSDVTILNPELARIAKSVALRAHSQVPASSPPPENTDTVQLSVRWKPHPLNEAGKEEVWVFKMNRDDNFRDLFEATADEAAILPESLIMNYKGKRIFSSVTPMTLQIWGEAELVACDKATYEYMRKNHVSSQLSFNTEPTPTPEELSDDEPFASQLIETASDADGDAFKLILRSTITKDITLTVRPTTKCGAIVKAFLKKAGVDSQYPGVFEAGAGEAKKNNKRGGRGQKAENKDPRLCVDGDRMGNDVEIRDADLEDGDLVEVVGL